jgi:hypothetical protein
MTCIFLEVLLHWFFCLQVCLKFIDLGVLHEILTGCKNKISLLSTAGSIWYWCIANMLDERWSHGGGFGHIVSFSVFVSYEVRALSHIVDRIQP